MVSKVKPILDWIRLTFLSASFCQKRYLPIKIHFDELQKEFCEFFEQGGEVKGYDFLSREGFFCISENNRHHIFGEGFAGFSNRNQPTISYEISKTENEFMLYLELDYQYPANSHNIKLFIKYFLFIVSLALLLFGIGTFIMGAIQLEQLFSFIPIPVVFLITLVVLSAWDTAGLRNANVRLLSAIRTLESGKKIERF